MFQRQAHISWLSTTLKHHGSEQCRVQNDHLQLAASTELNLNQVCQQELFTLTPCSLSTCGSSLGTRSLHSLTFLFKQRGGLVEAGHLVEQQLLSSSDWWSKWEKQTYNQDAVRARLCQDVSLARSEAGTGLRSTRAARGTDEVRLRWIRCKERLWCKQPADQEVGSRDSPKNLQTHIVHTKGRN